MFIIKEEYYGTSSIRDVNVYSANSYRVTHDESPNGLVTTVITDPNTEQAKQIIVTYKVYIMNERGETIDKILAPELGQLKIVSSNSDKVMSEGFNCSQPK